MKKWWIAGLALVGLAAMLAGCFPAAQEPEVVPEPTAAANYDYTVSASPLIPSSLEVVDGVPMLKVYKVDERAAEDMDIEQYVQGVLAGEMRNDWPMEALKAQAILARTFVLKFVDEKRSQYDGADISTDIKEAQAYDAAAVNERIKRAVSETRGLVMVSGGKLPYAWFHAHAGGMTELAKPGLDYKDQEPPYTRVTASPDSDKAPTIVKDWTASFGMDEVRAAAKETGVDVGDVKTIGIGERSASGRVVTLLINGKSVSAPNLRVALDSKKMKSTLLSSAAIEGDTVTFAGRGYGHGVGMSQWGAYAMAERGDKAERIVKQYFKDVEIERFW